MYNFATLIKEIKPYTLNPGMANEDLVNDFIAPLVISGNIKHRNGSDFIFSKARVSNLMNCKSEIPGVLKDATQRIGIQEKMITEYEDTIDILFDRKSLTNMIDKLSILIKDSDNLSDDEKSTILSAKEDVSAFLTKALITALRCRNVMGEKLTTIFSRGANSFDVIEDDIFKYSFNNRKKEHNITVIPVNSSFDTVITRKFENDSFPLISASTLHGKWIDRLIKSGLTVSEIDSMINESIIKRKIKAINHNAGAENSKQTNYPIGTVLPVEGANSMYYLLVISYFDENNVAHSTIADIEKALISLIEFYDIFGQGDNMYLPLLGTGRSRAGMSYQEAYDLIKKVVAEHPERIQGHVHLVVTKDVTIEY